MYNMKRIYFEKCFPGITQSCKVEMIFIVHELHELHEKDMERA